MSKLPTAASAATGTEPLDGLAGWAVGVMETLGGPGAALIVGLDNLFPPIPSELVLPLAGFAASQGAFSFAGALAWTTLGSVLGAIIVYAAGALLGRHRTLALMSRIPLVKTADFHRAEAWFARHGASAVFCGRMIPLFRSVISLPAGIERMKVSTFLVLTTLGSLIWNSIFVTAGHLLGANWHLVDRYAGIMQKIVMVGVIAALLAFIAVRVRARIIHSTTNSESQPVHTRSSLPTRSGKARPSGERPRQSSSEKPQRFGQSDSAASSGE